MLAYIDIVIARSMHVSEARWRMERVVAWDIALAIMAKYITHHFFHLNASFH